uniref:Retrotransposon protein, putative, unclassified n=1 Tax=Caenorhabditis tropicalis TaxID=1561998 RepID=A0A1I7TWB9_9PELO
MDWDENVPPEERITVEYAENGSQTDWIRQQEENLYEPEEMLESRTKKDILLGVDVEELNRKRVELHTENFCDVCLPFNHSLDVQSWSLQDVLEMTSQFMENNEVEAFRLAGIKGNMLVQPYDDLFSKLNEERAIVSWRSFKKFVNMMEKMKEGIARNARSYRPALSPSEKTFENKRIQVEPIETVVDKLDPEDGYVEVRGRRHATIDLMEQRVERWGSEFSAVALPFDLSFKETRWSHEQLVQVVAQFLPNAAVHAIDSVRMVHGCGCCDGSPWGMSMFKELNMNSATISVAEFLEIKNYFDLLKNAQNDWEKKEARLDAERMKELEMLEGLHSMSRPLPAKSNKDSEPPVKRAHVKENPKAEKGSQTDEDVLAVGVRYKPEEELICCTKYRILRRVDLDELRREKVELNSMRFHNVCLPFNHSLNLDWWMQHDILEMTSQFMTANEVERFRLTRIDWFMLDQPNEKLFFKLNQKKAILSWRTFKKFINMVDRVKIAIARSSSGPVINSGSSYFSPSAEEIFEEKGVQADLIETVVDKLEEENGHVEVGGKRHATIDLLEERVECWGAGFSTVALPFDQSFKNEHWTHEQLVEVVAQFLPNAAAHAIDSQPLVGCSFHRFYLDSPEGMELFKNLNLHTANISGYEFLQVGKYFESLLGARQDYEVKQKEMERKQTEQEEAE